MTPKPMRQIRSPKGRGTISSAVIRKAIKNVANEREKDNKNNKLLAHPAKKN